MIAESILCLALNVYFEARSEDLRGKVAVGSVVALYADRAAVAKNGEALP